MITVELHTRYIVLGGMGNNCEAHTLPEAGSRSDRSGFARPSFIQLYNYIDYIAELVVRREGVV